jgi:transcriptional regulator with XRE-family HTH domain
MDIGERIQRARKKTGINGAVLGKSVGLSGQAISKIEKNELKRGPDPRTLIRIADALNAPEILLHHCDQCPIRQHIMLRHYPELNNIRKDPASIVAKMRKEMQEAIEAADELGEKYLKVDFKNDPDYMDTFKHAMEQILDVERVIETLKFELVLNQIHTQDEVQQVIAQQQKKCERNGHHIPEKNEDSEDQERR